jgi:hypothetical protein
VYAHTAECDVAHDGGLSRPSYWRLDEKMLEDPKVLGHNEESSAYVTQMGTKLLQATIGSAVVGRCVRVEDENLWQKYATRRAAVRNKGVPRFAEKQPETLGLLQFSAKTTLDRSVNEVWLFHGTSEEAARAIGSSSFRLPGHPGLLGKGLYFAEWAAKSDGYSKKNDKGEKVMMLCRVILGQTLRLPDGQADHDAENLINGTSNDSLLGMPAPNGTSLCPCKGAREFLVYDNSLVYPEYIMFYKSS